MMISALSSRYTTPKTPIAERLCKQCVMNAVEDESRFYGTD